MTQSDADKQRMKMRSGLLLLALGLAVNLPAATGDYQVSQGEVGPISISLKIDVRNAKEELTAFPKKIAELTASGRNDSGQAIRYAKFCVQVARHTTGCDFSFWTNEVWMPGEELTWLIDKHAQRGVEDVVSVTLVSLRPLKAKKHWYSRN